MTRSIRVTLLIAMNASLPLVGILGTNLSDDTTGMYKRAILGR